MTGPSNATADLEFLRTLSLLYVEDEQETRTAMAHFLNRRFARVDVAINGQEGLECFTRMRQDVVITDIKMPVMDGLTMAARIKSIMHDVPIIVVTAYNETDFFLRAIEIGVDRYVKKPVDPNELIQAIQKSTLVHLQQRQLATANQHLLSTMETAIGALSRAIEMRDPYTDGHQKRVSQIATLIAMEMGLPDSQITGIRLGAIIHDIGKIAVPAELLTMPRKLSRIEFEFIKTHSQVGADILSSVEFPWPIAEMVGQHHERLDGSGYPNGVESIEILPEAKIIAVADVIEAMASHRPYRPGLGLEAAALEIKGNRGILYCPDAVDCCLALIERKALNEVLI
jgi:putative two-component system response regulator